MTADEIEAWLREAIKAVGAEEPFFIRADAQTSFAAVVDMLQRFKAAGVRSYELFLIVGAGGGNRLQHSLSGSVDNVRSEPFGDASISRARPGVACHQLSPEVSGIARAAGRGRGRHDRAGIPTGERAD